MLPVTSPSLTPAEPLAEPTVEGHSKQATHPNSTLKTHQHYWLLWLMLVTSAFLSGCAQLGGVGKPQHYDPNLDRTELLSTINNWQIKGQIAFIQPSKREKASIFWQHDESSQSLNLTTYLGINVMSLESVNGIHQLTIDGKDYQTRNLDQLIWQLTGLTFPSDALTYWVKAVPYSESDEINLSAENQLPATITSYYNNQQWHVQYSRYQEFQGVQLPTSILIKQQGLTIKLAIRQWQI